MTLPVVPNACGFGMYTRAAYGLFPGTVPTVYRVTNLNDAGPGSLRDALEAIGPRVVIFEISGYIEWVSDVTITSPYLTVAGQTAPSPGITVRAIPGSAEVILTVSTHDVLFQHFRIRPGSSTCNSALITYPGGLGNDLVLDHMSISWAQDEGVFFTSSNNITLWRCIVSEILVNAPGSGSCTGGGGSGGHGVIGYGGDMSFFQNLLAHNVERNFYTVSGGGRQYIANNLIYDGIYGPLWADNYGTGSPLAIAVGNYLRRNNTNYGSQELPAFACRGLAAGSQLYQNDNTLDNSGVNPDFTPFDVISGQGVDPRVSSPPFAAPGGYVPMSAASTYGFVLANAGARPTDRDAVDARIVADVAARTGTAISSPADVGGYPALAVNTRALTLPASPHSVTASGYTNLEVWLHGYAAAVEAPQTIRYMAGTGSDAAGDGSIGNPWQSLAFSLAQLAPGDTLYLRSGTYAGSSNMVLSSAMTIPSGTSGSHITIAAYPGETVTLQAPSGSAALELTAGESYLDWEGLIIDGLNDTSGGPSALVYQSGGTHHISYTRLEVKNGYRHGFQFSASGGGSDFNQVVSCSVHGCGRQPGRNTGYGLYIQTAGNLFEKNDVYANNAFGFYFDNGASLTVNSNTIRKNRSRLNACISRGTDINGHTGAGLALASGDGNLIYDNIFESNGVGGDAATISHGVWISSFTTNTKIYNNTCVTNTGSGIELQGYADSPHVTNNIAYGNTGGDIVDDGGTGAPTLTTNWVTTDGDPLFVNASASDFHLQAGSPCVGTGTTLADVPDDFDSSSRVSFAYDIGAFQRNGGPIPPAPSPPPVPPPVPSPPPPPPPPLLTASYLTELAKLNRQRAVYLRFRDRLYGKGFDPKGPLPVQGTVVQFGTFNRAVANIEMPIEIPAIAPTLIDDGNWWRSLAEPATELLLYKWVELYLRQIDDAGTVLDGRIATAQITDPDFPPERQVTLNCQVTPAEFMGSKIPRRQVTTLDFPRCAPEANGKAVPCVYGEHSNARVSDVVSSFVEVGGGLQRRTEDIDGTPSVTRTLAYRADVTAGNLLVGGAGTYQGLDTVLDATVTDTIGTVYNVIQSPLGSVGGIYSGPNRGVIWFGIAPVSGPNTVFLSVNTGLGAPFFKFSIDEFSGEDPINTLDVVGVMNDFPFNPAPVGGAHITPIQPGDLLLGLLWWMGHSPIGGPVLPPATNIGLTTGADCEHSFAFQIVGAAGPYVINWDALNQLGTHAFAIALRGFPTLVNCGVAPGTSQSMSGGALRGLLVDTGSIPSISTTNSPAILPTSEAGAATATGNQAILGGSGAWVSDGTVNQDPYHAIGAVDSNGVLRWIDAPGRASSPAPFGSSYGFRHVWNDPGASPNDVTYISFQIPAGFPTWDPFTNADPLAGVRYQVLRDASGNPSVTPTHPFIDWAYGIIIWDSPSAGDLWTGIIQPTTSSFHGPRYLWAGHTCKGIDQVFVFKPDLTLPPTDPAHGQNIQILQVVGVDYVNEVLEINGNRYHTSVFKNLQQNPTTCEQYEVSANLRGAETLADGTGILITDALEMTLHILLNWIFNSYRSSVGPYAPSGGRWFTDVPYGSGLINVPSFLIAQAVSLARIPGGYLGAGALVDYIEARQLIQDLIVSFGLDWYFDNNVGNGAWSVKLFDPSQLVRSALPQLTPDDTFFKSTFTSKFAVEMHANVCPYFAGPMTGRLLGQSTTQSGGYTVSGEVPDYASIRKYGEILAQPIYLKWTKDPFTAYDVVYRHLQLVKWPPILARATTIIGMLQNSIASEVAVTHPDGLGSTSGWVQRVCRIFRSDLNLDAINNAVLLRDVDAQVP